MKNHRNLWILLWIVVALFALFFVALAPGFVWSQSAPPARLVRLRTGMPMGDPSPHPVATHNQMAAPLSPTFSFDFGMIDFPRQVGSLAAEANKSGQIVGGYGPQSQLNEPTDHGFLLTGNKFKKIDYPGAAWTQPNALNDAGVIVGWYGTSLYGKDTHAFMLSGSTYTNIDFPGATEGTLAAAINKSGDIVGSWGDTTTIHGFLLSNGVFTQIDVPGAFYTETWGINSAGDIVGWYGANFNDSHGFIYSQGQFTTLDFPGFSQNYVADITDTGVIAGGYGDFTTVNGVLYQWQHCYLYQNGQFTNCDAPFGPPAVTQVWHLNNHNRLTGAYVDSSGTVYGYVAKVGP